MNVYRVASHSMAAPPKRVGMAPGVVESCEVSTPAPAYTDLRRTKSSIPLRIIRRLTRCDVEYDPRTIPVLSRREQKKAERREQRKLEELQAYQRKEFHDRISRQLEVNQMERSSQTPPPQLARRSVRDKVKDTLKRTKKSVRHGADPPSSTAPALATTATASPPHVDDFADKAELRQWFHGPQDVEALPPPTTIPLPYAAELDATGDVSPCPSINQDLPKKTYEEPLDMETLPPPIRSPSPCVSAFPPRGMTISETVSAFPQRGMTISETVSAPIGHKQMQCDSCHDAIKITGFHYSCDYCNDGDCLYCAKCVNGGRTCRHELIERTRNIKRHPTNPQNLERKALALDRDSVIPAEAHIELSAMHPHSVLPPLKTTPSEPSSDAHASSSASPVACESPTTPADMLREFETKRREQEIAFREKEVTLREREAMLREREAWTASRERDAALVQQLHAAAMLQQRAEVGSQFSPVSPMARQPSLYGGLSRQSSAASRPGYHQCLPVPEAAPSLSRPFGGQPSPPITFHSSEKGKKAHGELATSVAAMEATIANLDINDDAVRNRANSAKRKASSDSKAPGRGSLGKKGGPSSRRSTSRDYDDDDVDEDEGSDAGSSKRQKQDVATDEPQKLFACPYFKHDPLRYAEGNTGELHYRGCAAGLLRDISRVKQHLKRTHHRPDYYCRRCFGVFENDELLQRHMSSQKGCNAKACPYPEKLDEAQQLKIHVKRPGKDPRDLWYEIYSTIFPGAPHPDSPYIEQSQTKQKDTEVLGQFIDSFNRRLDVNPARPAWLDAPEVRDWLTAQMRLTLQDVQRQPSSVGGASPMQVSPVSPPESRFLHRPPRHTSRASSRETKRRPSSATGQSLAPPPPSARLRPALKVTTSQPHSPTLSGSPMDSSRSSRQASGFPRVPSHVCDDAGYGDGAGESWVSGDDMPLMGDTAMDLREPASATSTRSTKSVSFATAPPEARSAKDKQDHSFVLDWPYMDDPVETTHAPSLLDFASVDWSAHHFANGMPGHQAPIWQKTPQRADSAYGTLSSAQNSRTSLFHAPPYAQLSQEQLTCVDPSQLFVDQELGTCPSGLSADVQAYFNRDLTGYRGSSANS